MTSSICIVSLSYKLNCSFTLNDLIPMALSHKKRKYIEECTVVEPSSIKSLRLEEPRFILKEALLQTKPNSETRTEGSLLFNALTKNTSLLENYLQHKSKTEATNPAFAESRLPTSQKICRICSIPLTSTLAIAKLSSDVCQGCAGFFIFALQSESMKQFTCNKSSACVVTYTSPHLCHYCKYQKCLREGLLLKVLKYSHAKTTDISSSEFGLNRTSLNQSASFPQSLSPSSREMWSQEVLQTPSKYDIDESLSTLLRQELNIIFSQPSGNEKAVFNFIQSMVLFLIKWVKCLPFFKIIPLTTTVHLLTSQWCPLILINLLKTHDLVAVDDVALQLYFQLTRKYVGVDINESERKQLIASFESLREIQQSLRSINLSQDGHLLLKIICLLLPVKDFASNEDHKDIVQVSEWYNKSFASYTESREDVSKCKEIVRHLTKLSEEVFSNYVFLLPFFFQKI